MKTIDVERKTVDEAIQQGLEDLGLSLEEVRIDVLDEGSKGLFGLIGAKNARVRLTVREDEEGGEIGQALSAMREEPVLKQAAHPAPVETARRPAQEQTAPRKPVQTRTDFADRPVRAARGEEVRPERPPQPKPPRPEREDTIRTRVREREVAQPLEAGEADATIVFLVETARLMGAEITVEVSEREGTLCLDIQGDDKGILIGHRGETLDALQYLTGLVHNKDKQTYRRIQLDAQNYRKKREETLIRLANRLADKARRSGRRVTLEPMNPYERRILHSALQNNAYVQTHSEGDEPNRRVVILPKQQGREA